MSTAAERLAARRNKIFNGSGKAGKLQAARTDQLISEAQVAISYEATVNSGMEDVIHDYPLSSFTVPTAICIGSHLAIQKMPEKAGEIGKFAVWLAALGAAGMVAWGTLRANKSNNMRGAIKTHLQNVLKLDGARKDIEQYEDDVIQLEEELDSRVEDMESIKVEFGELIKFCRVLEGDIISVGGVNSLKTSIELATFLVQFASEHPGKMERINVALKEAAANTLVKPTTTITTLVQMIRDCFEASVPFKETPFGRFVGLQTGVSLPKVHVLGGALKEWRPELEKVKAAADILLTAYSNFLVKHAQSMKVTDGIVTECRIECKAAVAELSANFKEVEKEDGSISLEDLFNFEEERHDDLAEAKLVAQMVSARQAVAQAVAIAKECATPEFIDEFSNAEAAVAAAEKEQDEYQQVLAEAITARKTAKRKEEKDSTKAATEKAEADVDLASAAVAASKDVLDKLKSKKELATKARASLKEKMEAREKAIKAVVEDGQKKFKNQRQERKDKLTRTVSEAKAKLERAIDAKKLSHSEESDTELGAAKKGYVDAVLDFLKLGGCVLAETASFKQTLMSVAYSGKLLYAKGFITSEDAEFLADVSNILAVGTSMNGKEALDKFFTSLGDGEMSLGGKDVAHDGLLKFLQGINSLTNERVRDMVLEMSKAKAMVASGYTDAAKECLSRVCSEVMEFQVELEVTDQHAKAVVHQAVDEINRAVEVKFKKTRNFNKIALPDLRIEATEGASVTSATEQALMPLRSASS